MRVLLDIDAEIFPSASLSNYATPSASVAILEGEDLETHVFTTTNENSDTLYRADSNSKAITSIGVARLVDQGLLSFDDKITDYVDAKDFLHDTTSGGLVEYVTIKMLMTHMSGLVWNTFCDHSEFPGFTGHACWHFNHFPGCKWHYDDVFCLVGKAMETVTGRSFPDLMRELVTEPLGMTRTFWQDLPTSETDLAKPHFRGVEAPIVPLAHQDEFSTYGMWTTASDLLRAISAMQESLQASTPFLSQETAEFVILKGATPLRSVGESSEQLGLGWYVTSTTFGHRGCRGTNGYHSYFFAFYGQGMTGLQATSMAVMTNAFEGLTVIRALVSAVMYAKRWPRQVLMPSNLGIDASLPCAAPREAEADPSWKEWKGAWSKDSQRGWRLIEEDGQPMLKFRGMDPVKLRPAAVPCAKFMNNKKELTFICPRPLNMGIRLTWSGEKRILELLFTFTAIALDREADD